MFGIEFHPIDWLMKNNSIKKFYPYEAYLNEAVERGHSEIYVTSEDRSGMPLDRILSFTGKTFIHFEDSKPKLVAKYSFGDSINSYESSFRQIEAWRLEKVDELRSFAHEMGIKVIDKCAYKQLTQDNIGYQMLI